LSGLSYRFSVRAVSCIEKMLSLSDRVDRPEDEIDSLRESLDEIYKNFPGLGPHKNL